MNATKWNFNPECGKDSDIDKKTAR